MSDRLETLLDRIGESFTSGVSKFTLSDVVTTSSVNVLADNPDRIGLIIYNNSANSVYIKFGDGPCSSSTNMSIIIATFTQFVMPLPVWRGEVHAIRNSGTGKLLITELLKDP